MEAWRHGGMELPLTGHDFVGIELSDKSDECESVKDAKHLFGQGR